MVLAGFVLVSGLYRRIANSLYRRSGRKLLRGRNEGYLPRQELMCGGVASLLFLAFLGALAARTGGANMWPDALTLLIDRQING